MSTDTGAAGPKRPGAQELLDLAAAVAAEAGAMLAGERAAGGVSVLETKSSPTDVVTAMDKASEALITERIRAVRPRDGFFGEEGSAEPGSSGVRWIIDPIDGTVNYLYDQPEWAVSVAAEVDGAVVAGAVNVVRRAELFTAVRGGGARLNGEPISVNPAPELPQALVATGFAYAPELRAHQARLLTGVLSRVRDIRRGGSCAADLCSLAVGRVDAYYERGPHYWDWAAAGLIAAEAGARFGRVGGGEPGEDLTLLAAPPGLFEALSELLAPLEPDAPVQRA
ncbi:inositol monophosphatase family protein [Allonocardiopsis opalescens]|uniref:inositol-phosphate phosphatase n=1 Tax=Allonocardiopsis opalescens TaxID=1144618 RepID=A0A2T0PU59_9ACTN|nr:inositol monophosphatase family protein [Allonocardiopsis opalescens]PRX92437.1 myo-inositol-1(or 4)-monophosphatase [Allonocardiopsis opalescens]